METEIDREIGVGEGEPHREKETRVGQREKDIERQGATEREIEKERETGVGEREIQAEIDLD